jgi:hypothetical protein
LGLCIRHRSTSTGLVDSCILGRPHRRPDAPLIDERAAMRGGTAMECSPWFPLMSRTERPRRTTRPGTRARSSMTYDLGDWMSVRTRASVAGQRRAATRGRIATKAAMSTPGGASAVLQIALFTPPFLCASPDTPALGCRARRMARTPPAQSGGRGHRAEPCAPSRRTWQATKDDGLPH